MTMRRFGFALLLVCLGSFTPMASTQEPRPLDQNVSQGLAATPPMGWNSWNHFACNVDEALIRHTADAMVSSGMRDAGYEYLVIDDCWHGVRDENGFIQADAKRFPAGMSALADYLHQRGLKFGIYSDAGTKTCGGRPGSRGHEFQDALQYARWGVDYLKYDWCSTSTQNAEASYKLMREALDASGRQIVFSMCEWGTSKPWLWASNVGNLWRTTGDIDDKWEGKFDYKSGIMTIVDLNEPLYPFAGPGHWNDPDMLEVGNGGLSLEEYRTHFSLWAMMAAPLMAGNDIAHMTEETKSILLNREVIRIDQDRLGRAGHRVRKNGTSEVWARELSDGSRAVVLLNRGETPASISVAWHEIGLPDKLQLQARDLWKKQDMGSLRGSLTATAVPPHSVVMVTLKP